MWEGALVFSRKQWVGKSGLGSSGPSKQLGAPWWETGFLSPPSPQRLQRKPLGLGASAFYVCLSLSSHVAGFTISAASPEKRLDQ